MSTVPVDCPHRQGIELRLFEVGKDPMASSPAVPKGDAVFLKHGRNEVDAEFWKDWLAQQPDEKPQHGLAEIEEKEEKP